jgi:hypothetical protein
MRGAISVVVLALAGVVAGTSAAAPARHEACAKTKVVKGKRVCVKQAAPPLAPSKRGHYTGATAQNAAISFDVVVTGGRVVLRTITVPELDEPCSPGGDVVAFSIAFGSFPLYPAKSGHVHMNVSFDRGTSGRGTFVLDGTVNAAGKASGTLVDTESLNSNGQTLACTTGTIAWSGGTGAASVKLAPRPQPGHYHGVTSQGASIDFDVVSNGGVLYAQGLAFVEIDESCSPGQVPIALYDVSFGTAPMLVDGHGHLHFVYQQLPSSSLDPGGRTFTLDGTLDPQGHAAGTVTDHQVLAEDTGPLTCDTGPVTWSATAG